MTDTLLVGLQADSTPLLGAGFAVLTVALLLLGPSPLLGLQQYKLVITHVQVVGCIP